MLSSQKQLEKYYKHSLHTSEETSMYVYVFVCMCTCILNTRQHIIWERALTRTWMRYMH